MRFWRKKVVPVPTLREFIKAELMLEIAKGYDDIEGGSIFMRSAMRGAAKDIRKQYQPVVDAWKAAKP